MKRYMERCIILISMLLIAAVAFAADVRLAWDPAPAGETWTFVRIYEQTAPGVYTQVAQVAGNLTEATVANVTPGVHTYVARSANQWGESANSNAVSTPGPAGIPRITSITITIP